jgi:hypothetical protein
MIIKELLGQVKQLTEFFPVREAQGAQMKKGRSIDRP